MIEVIQIRRIASFILYLYVKYQYNKSNNNELQSSSSIMNRRIIIHEKVLLYSFDSFSTNWFNRM